VLFCRTPDQPPTAGTEVSIAGLADIFFELQERGAHNINLVSPTPYAPPIAAAIWRAKDRGISIPFVYNTNAYETRETIALFNGLIDIYLPDFKYWSGPIAKRLSAAPDYPVHAMAAILEMHSQVGDLVLADGLAGRGLLVRHLVLPGGLAGTRKVMQWIGETLGSKQPSVSCRSITPCEKASEYRLLDRPSGAMSMTPLVAFMDEQV
jgi:putative pyruvate formate lyase activating enzyme